MGNPSTFPRVLISLSIFLLMSGVAIAQRSGPATSASSNSGFGPVMRAYLGYLNNEEEVVDDRASRHEITPAYYRRNLGRIRALRQMAIRLVRQSDNDYVPELEAVTGDELGMLFDPPPKPTTLRADETVANKFRFLAAVHSGEVFYLFARLDPYEQAELLQRQKKAPVSPGPGPGVEDSGGVTRTTNRPRRAVPHQ